MAAAASSASVSSTTSYDMYDFSGVSTNDLAILRSQLFTSLNLSSCESSFKPNTAMDTSNEDDEEWYPPSPPIYDVTDKLIEVNREFFNDPTSTCHLAGRLRWKPDDNLVQIKWLYSSDVCERTNYYHSESDESSADETHDSLATHLAMRLNLLPPKIELTTIEDVSPDNSEQHTITLVEPPSITFQPPPECHDVQDYDDEDFEEPSLAENEMKSPLLRDEDIVSQMETIELSSVSSSSSGSSESCKTTKTSLKQEAVSDKIRPTGRPRTKTTIIRTGHDNSRSSSTSNTAMPKSNCMKSVSKNRASDSRGSCHANNNSGIKIAHSNNNNNYSSSSGEEGSCSLSYNPPASAMRRSSAVEIPPLTTPPTSKPRLRSSSLQPTTNTTRKVITESRPKTACLTPKSKTSIYITNGPGLNGVPARPRGQPTRKASRNSLSSNSSVSSQTTEDGNTSNSSTASSSTIRRNYHHPMTVADVISAENPYFLQWKKRKREEKKLRERKSFLEQQMRRPFK